MKKIILSAFLLASGFSLFAQNNGSVPDNIRVSFENTYQGTTNVTWELVTLPVFSQYSRLQLPILAVIDQREFLKKLRLL